MTMVTQKSRPMNLPSGANKVERSFGVLDGAILVISAVEGIQAQTKFLMNILKKLEIPTIIFINKIDRVGAQSHSLVEQIKSKLAASVIPLNRPGNLGMRQASIVENRFDGINNQAFSEASIDLLSRHDDQLLEAYIDDGQVTEAQT